MPTPVEMAGLYRTSFDDYLASGGGTGYTGGATR
jgi:hypothetical protein